MFKPAGYPSLSPYLIVPDAEALLAFARAAFDATPSFVHREAGRIRHAELRIDDSIVMVGEMDAGVTAHLHLYVPDADAACARAIAAGATVVQPVAEKGDGDRRGGVADPSGTVWWLSTQISERNG